MGRIVRAGIVAVAAAIGIAGCIMKDQPPPPLAGPSELALSLSVHANPDVLPLDGQSQSQIVVQARDASARPVGGVGLRAEILFGGVSADFGRLSARTLATRSDGQAVFIYTAPLIPDPVDPRAVVTIAVVPAGNDYSGALARSVDIRLVPPDGPPVLPPNAPPVPNFTFSPQVLVTFQTVQFDGSSSSDPDGQIVSYAWSFGDGNSGTGRTTPHQYRAPGNYGVTLTVTDNRGASKTSDPKSVIVNPSTIPTASFVFSPANPAPGQDIFFNAEASRAAPGRRLVSYDWDFGSGRTGSGITVTKRYDTPGNYRVTLVVTDDVGQRDARTSDVIVTTSGTGPVVAAFSVSPTTPTPGQRVFFNGSDSTSPSGIASYNWDFGDGGTSTGVTTDHVYAAAGSYVVRLTVRDNAGRTATVTRTVLVGTAAPPTADFVFSPASPSVGQTVSFNGTLSTASSGRSIVSWSWNFGDGTPTGTGSTTGHTFTAVGAFTVVLTVTDNTGATGARSQTVTVQ